MLTDITAEGYALLQAIAGSESGGKYNIRFDGKAGSEFSDYSKHPDVDVVVPWREDGKTSDAAGKYQFLGSTWNPIATKYGLPDFSPASQDKGAWILAQRDYKEKTGRDLQGDLEAGKVDKAMNVLSTTWTSLPGGAEKNAATSGAMKRYEASFENCGYDLTCYSTYAGNAVRQWVRKATGQTDDTETNPAVQAVEGKYADWFGMRILVGIGGAVILAIGLTKLKV